MFFRVLGPLEVTRDDGTPLAINGARRRGLLLRLLVDAGQPVSADRLLDDVWEGQPPGASAATLQSHVSQLRRVLGPDRLVGARGGYTLSVADDEVDAAIFETEFRRGQGLLSNDPGRAREMLDLALGRWRGPALVDAAGAAWSEPEVVRLEELRQDATETRIDAVLELGLELEAVALAEMAVAECPLRERRWAQLILSLYRASRQAEALRAFQRLRTRLADDLGIEPSAELRSLEHAVLMQDPALTWSGAASCRAPMPLRLSAIAESALFPFVGRHDELLTLHDGADAASRLARLSTVLVEGEPGAGKTRLVAEGAATAHARGFTVCFGSCEESAGVPYGAWIGVLSQLLARGQSEVRRTLDRAARASLARISPTLARLLDEDPRSSPNDQEHDRFFLRDAVTDVLAAATSVQPIFVVLDDLHWADVSTLHLLKHIVTAPKSMRAMIVGTYRETELSSSHPLARVLADLRREAVQRVELAGLRVTDVADLVEAALGDVPNVDRTAITASLHRETDGNAFFVTELLRDRRAGVPASVTEVLDQRVARLGPDAARLLTHAAVIGHEFDVDVLARVVQRDTDEVIDLLDGAATAALVTDVELAPGRYRFAHALIRRALYDGLSRARRQQTHRRVAEALEVGGIASPAAIAEHWLGATRPPDVAIAVDRCVQAAEAALQMLAPVDAIAWYERALELHSRAVDPDEQRRAELLVGLGEAQRQTGLPDYRATILEAGRVATTVSNGPLLVTAALCRTPLIESYIGIDTERLSLVERALNAVGAEPTAERARLLAALAADYTDPRDWRRGHALAAEAIDVARRTGDPRTFLFVVNTVANIRCTPALLVERLEETREALHIANDHGDGFDRHLARYTRVLACVEAGALNEADEHIAAMVSFVDRHPIPSLEWQAFTLQSWRRLLAGDTASAEAVADRAADAARRARQPLGSVVHALHLSRIRREQGRLVEEVDRLAQLAVQYPSVAVLQALLVLAYCEVGELDRAKDNFDVLATDGFESFQLDIGWLTAVTTSADAAVDLGMRDAAQLLYRRLAPYGSHVISGPATFDGAVARVLGRLCTLISRHDEAQSWFAQALALHERIRAPYWTARTQLDLAHLFAVQGRTNEATDLARLALETTETCRYSALHQHARALIGG